MHILVLTHLRRLYRFVKLWICRFYLLFFHTTIYNCTEYNRNEIRYTEYQPIKVLHPENSIFLSKSLYSAEIKWCFIRNPKSIFKNKCVTKLCRNNDIIKTSTSTDTSIWYHIICFTILQWHSPNTILIVN